MLYFVKVYRLEFINLILLIIMMSGCIQKQNRSSFWHPADFESTASTAFIWSTEHQEIIPKLIATISQKDHVTIFSENSEAEARHILKKHGYRTENVTFIKWPNKLDNIWIRDFGPVYLKNLKGEKKLVSFSYFGAKPGLSEEVSADRNIPLITSSLNSTGGAREVNGKGTILLCETHEMEVNYPKTKVQIETELKEKLAIRKVIWLKKGIPQDDNPMKGPIHGQIYPNGINGHVDEFCRFADSRTILISSVTEQEADQHPILAEAKKRLDENYDILSKSTDQDGKKFNIIKVPYAPLHIVDRSTSKSKVFVAPVTSYLNFIITNSMVIIPSYLSGVGIDQEVNNKEEELINILRRVFPTRQIIKIPTEGLNYFSGGFHCISINEPV